MVCNRHHCAGKTNLNICVVGAGWPKLVTSKSFSQRIKGFRCYLITSFKKTRELLEGCYLANIISDEKFVLLYECSLSKNLESLYEESERFDLEETECIAEFAASHFSLISWRACPALFHLSTPLSLHSFCVLARYLSSKSLRCSLTDFFVTRNFNVTCELRLSAIVCHTFPLTTQTTVLALWRYDSSNKTSRARARSWLGLHSITKLKELKVKFQSHLRRHFLAKHELKKDDEFLQNITKSFFRALLMCRWLVSQDKNGEIRNKAILWCEKILPAFRIPFRELAAHRSQLSSLETR